MDNKNMNNKENNIEKKQETPRRTPRPTPQGNAALLAKEKIVIIVSMAAIAAVLLSVVLLISFCGKNIVGGHIHDYELSLDTVGGEFFLYGVCMAEDCDSPKYAEENLADVVVVKEVPPSCNQQGSVTYGVERFGKTYTYVKTVEKTNHMLNGIDVSEAFDENGCLMYGTPTVVPSPGVSIKSCNSVVDGHYTCSACKGIVLTKIFVPHVSDNEWTVKPENAPTCTEVGIEQSHCKFCDTVMEEREIPMLSHNYKYKLTLEGDRCILTTSCSNGGCSVKTTSDVTSSVTREEKEATCSHSGRIVISYSKDGVEAETYIETSASTGNHVLDGQVYTHFLDEDGRIAYDVPGLKFNAGGTLHCGEFEDPYFICEGCKELVRLECLMPEHSYTVGEVIADPSLKNKGLCEVVCSNDWCKKESVSVILEEVKIGKNAVVIEEETAERGAIVKYTAMTDFGFEIVIEVTLPKE